jgi:hypothetical protein
MRARAIAADIFESRFIDSQGRLARLWFQPDGNRIPKLDAESG